MFNQMNDSSEEFESMPRGFLAPGPGRKLTDVTPGVHRQQGEEKLKVVMKPVDELTPYKEVEERIPRLSDEEYQELKKDIKERGIQVQIEINKDAEIICGHNRWRAAKELGFPIVPCIERDLDTEDVLSHAIRDNLYRRQLSKEQRYLLIEELLKKYGKPQGRPKKRGQGGTIKKNQEEIAKMTKVSKRTVKRAAERMKQKGRPERPVKPEKETFKDRKEFKNSETFVENVSDHLSGLVQEHGKNIISTALTTTIKKERSA